MAHLWWRRPPCSASGQLTRGLTASGLSGTRSHLSPMTLTSPRPVSQVRDSVKVVWQNRKPEGESSGRQWRTRVGEVDVPRQRGRLVFTAWTVSRPSCTLCAGW